MAELERLFVRIDATTDGLTQGLRRADQAVASSARVIDAQVNRMGSAFDRLNRFAANTRNILGGIVAARGVQEIIQYSDTWKQLEGRLKIVTKSGSELAKVQEQLFGVAQRNRSSLEGVTSLYTRLSMSTENNVKVQGQLLQVTEAVAAGLAITGESAASAQGLIVQLSQAFAGNFKTSAQELNSLLEQGPRVAKAIADGLNELGVTSNATAGDLKRLAKDGILTTENVAEALASQLGVLRKELEQTSLTVGQAFGRLDNAFLSFIGHSDSIQSGTNSIALGINAMAENFDAVAKASVAAAGVLTARFFGPVLNQKAAMAAAEVAVQRAVLSGNAVMMDSLRAIEMRAAEEARASAASVTETQGRITALKAEQATIEANIALFAQERAAAVAAVQMKAGLSAAGFAGGNEALVLQQRQAATIGLINSQKALKVTTAGLAAEEAALVAATGRATLATEAHTAAMAATTLGARAAALATTALRTTLAFLGGPAGLLITAATAFFLFRDSTDEASEAVERHKQALDFLKVAEEGAAGVAELNRQRSLDEAAAHIQAAEAALKQAEAELQLVKARLQMRSIAAPGSTTGGVAPLFGETGAELEDRAAAAKKSIEEQLELIGRLKKASEETLFGDDAPAGESVAQLTDKQKKYTEALRDSVSDTERLKAANEQSLSSYEKLKIEIDATNELRKQGFKEGTEEFNQNKALIIQGEMAQKAIEKHNDARDDAGKKVEQLKKKTEQEIEKQAEYTDELTRSIEQVNRLKAANDNSKESYENLRIEIDAENEARRQGFELGTREFKQIKEGIILREKQEKAIEDTNKAREEADRKREQAQERLKDELARPFENAAENIQNLFSDTFEGVFDGSIDSAEEAADAMKRIFIRLAAEMATLAIFRPEVLAAGGVGGLAGGIFSGGSSAASGGGGLPFGSDTLLSKGIGATGIGASIDAFGASVLPSIFGTGAPLAGTVGPTMAGSLGGMGIGLSTIALPVAALAATALISGVFKKSRPHPASTFSFGGVGDNGKLQDLDIRAKHIGEETARGFSDAISQSLTALQQIGLTFGGLAPVQGGVDDGRGFLKIGDKSIGFNPQDEDDAQRAISDLILTITQSAANVAEVFSDEATAALSRIETHGRDLQAVMSDVAFAAGFDALLKMPEELSQVEQAVKDLETAFDGIRDTADRLGLSLDKVNAAEQARLDKLRSQFTGDLTLSLLEGMAPNIRQLAEEEKRFLGQLKDAAALGLGQDTIARINALHQKNVELLTKGAEETQDIAQNARDMVSRFGSVSDKFKKLLFDLQFGQLSPLNPRQRLDALRGQVRDLGNRARLGDADAADQLAEVLPEFVQLSAEFNGFNKNFESDRAMAEDLAKATKSVADRQLEIQKRLLDEGGKQTGLLSILAGGSSSAGNANDKIFSLVQSGKLSTESAHAIIRSAGFTGTIGGGKVQAAFDADPAMNQRAFALLKAAGFASGGMVMGGIPGMDSVPAMLSPGEVVMRARAVQAIGAGTLLDANRTGRIANDNKVVEQLLGRLINVTQSLVNVTAASGNQTVAGLHGVQAELSDISNKARLEAAK